MIGLATNITANCLATLSILASTCGVAEESEPPPTVPTVEALEAVEEVAPFLLQDISEEEEADTHVSSGQRDDSTSDNNGGDAGVPLDAIEVVGEWQTYEATAYTAQCNGCSGITKTGVDVRSSIYHEGKRVIAVDPARIALGSSVEVRLADGTTFEAKAEDIGGAIKGARIDVLVGDKGTAREFGRQSVEVRVIE